MENIVKLINKAKNITVATGAGISVSGGIDYQTSNKEWKYEEDRFSVMSYPFFKQEPERFWEIYREIRVEEINKTPFHDFVKSMEDNADVTVVTQNVDGLHQEAGSENVIEVHGNRNRLICINENILFSIDLMDKEKTPKCPNCSNVLKKSGSRFLSCSLILIKFQCLEELSDNNSLVYFNSGGKASKSFVVIIFFLNSSTFL